MAKLRYVKTLEQVKKAAEARARPKPRSSASPWWTSRQHLARPVELDPSTPPDTAAPIPPAAQTTLDTTDDVEPAQPAPDDEAAEDAWWQPGYQPKAR
jgi:hypothetical protein